MLDYLETLILWLKMGTQKLKMYIYIYLVYQKVRSSTSATFIFLGMPEYSFGNQLLLFRYGCAYIEPKYTRIYVYIWGLVHEKFLLRCTVRIKIMWKDGIFPGNSAVTYF